MSTNCHQHVVDLTPENCIQDQTVWKRLPLPYFFNSYHLSCNKDCRKIVMENTRQKFQFGRMVHLVWSYRRVRNGLIHQYWCLSALLRRWGHNSVITAWALSLYFPDKLHLERNNFCRPNYQELHLLYRELMNWSANYIIHLYSRSVYFTIADRQKPRPPTHIIASLKHVCKP